MLRHSLSCNDPTSSASHRSTFLLRLAFAAVLIFVSVPAHAQGLTVQGRFNLKPITYVVGRNGKYRAPINGNFSVHASGYVTGAANPNPVIMHSPAQAGNIGLLAPLVLAKNNTGTIDRAIKNPLVAQLGGYATSPKAFNGMATSVTATQTNAGVTATGIASVTFTLPGGVKPTGDTAGSAATVTRAPKSTATGIATSYVEDPVNYAVDADDVQPGDTLVGQFSLSASDFDILVNDPTGEYAGTFESGTDLFGTSASLSPLGQSFAGNPLIFILSISTDSTNAPIVTFEHDPSFTFYDGSDTDLTSPLSDSSVDSTISSELSAALQGSPGSEYTLASDLPLFSYSAMVPDSLTDTLSIDTSNAQIAMAGAPEPSPLVATGFGMIGIAALAVAARKRAGAA